VSRTTTAGVSGSRTLLPVVLAVLVALLLPACVSIPTQGRVVAGADVNQQGVRSALRVTAAGPAEGADARQIVEGFLAALAGLDDYTVAREFLAPDALSWRPGDATVVYDGVPVFAPTITDDDEATVAVRATVVARIDQTGRYTEQAPTVEEQEFRLEQVDGEWRIVDLPAGVLVSQVDAERVLTPFGVYFLDPTSTYLVPDVRWFPQLTSSATSLVRALLGGPSPPYLGALRSAAPTGTRLDLPTVPVENGVATVDLTEEVLIASSEERALLLAQLRQTLRAVPGVSSVQVTVDGSPLDEPVGTDGVGTPTLVVDPPVDDRPVVLGPPPESSTGGSEPEPTGSTEATEGTDAPDGEPAELAVGDDGRPIAPDGSVVLRLDLDGASPLPGVDGLAGQVVTGLAIAPDGNSVAGLDAARGSLWVQQPGASPVELVTGRRLTTPSFDPPPLAWLWTVSAPDPDGDGVPVVLAAASAVEEVEARWLAPGDEVRALRVSRDGSRVLVVLAHADGSVDVQVRGVRRDANGRPLSLSQAAFDLAPELVDAVDAAWVNDDQVVVLGRSGEEPLRPVLARVGGDTEPLAPTPNAVSIASALGERNIVVGTADGTVLRRSGSLWLDGPFGVSPAFGG
jgi:hypothetical protein